MYKFFSSFPFSTHAAAFYFFALSNNHLDVWLSFISYLGRIWFRSPCVVHPYHLFFPFAAEGQDNSTSMISYCSWVLMFYSYACAVHGQSTLGLLLW